MEPAALSCRDLYGHNEILTNGTFQVALPRGQAKVPASGHQRGSPGPEVELLCHGILG